MIALLFPLAVALGMGATKVTKILRLHRTAPLYAAVSRAEAAKGYAPGEGLFTMRTEGAGLWIHAQSENPIGRVLAECASLHSGMAKFAGRRLDLTEGEGEVVRTMLLNITNWTDEITSKQQMLMELVSAKTACQQGGMEDDLELVNMQIDALTKEILKLKKFLKEAIDPVYRYLKRFPSSRIIG